MVSLLIVLNSWNLLSWWINYSLTMIHILLYIQFKPLNSRAGLYITIFNQYVVCLFLFFTLWCTDYVQDEKFTIICAKCMIYLFYIGISINIGLACVLILSDALQKAKKLYYWRNVVRFRDRMHRNRFHSG